MTHPAHTNAQEEPTPADEAGPGDLVDDTLTFINLEGQTALDLRKARIRGLPNPTEPDEPVRLGYAEANFAASTEARLRGVARSVAHGENFRLMSHSDAPGICFYTDDESRRIGQVRMNADGWSIIGRELPGNMMLVARDGNVAISAGGGSGTVEVSGVLRSMNGIDADGTTIRRVGRARHDTDALSLGQGDERYAMLGTVSLMGDRVDDLDARHDLTSAAVDELREQDLDGRIAELAKNVAAGKKELLTRIRTDVGMLTKRDDDIRSTLDTTMGWVKEHEASLAELRKEKDEQILALTESNAELTEELSTAMETLTNFIESASKVNAKLFEKIEALEEANAQLTIDLRTESDHFATRTTRVEGMCTDLAGRVDAVARGGEAVTDAHQALADRVRAAAKELTGDPPVRR